MFQLRQMYLKVKEELGDKDSEFEAKSTEVEVLKLTIEQLKQQSKLVGKKTKVGRIKVWETTYVN